MRAAVRKLGNSSGIIIPKSLLTEVGVAVGDAMDVTAEEGRIVMIPLRRRPRTGWAEASRKISQEGDDAPVWPEFRNLDDNKTSTW
jgi:antitoxin MazE